VISNLKSKFFELIEKPKFTRIAECIIGCFQIELIEFIVKYCIDNFMKFIKSREGYFLIRTIIKAVKIQKYQMSIANIIEKNYLRLTNTSNGSLLIQCIIHNFPATSFKYFKSCSKHLDNNPSKEETELNKHKDFTNKALKLVIKVILEHCYLWDSKYAYPIVDCLLRVGSTAFETVFMQNYEKPIRSNSDCSTILDTIARLKCSDEILDRIYLCLSSSNKKKVNDYFSIIDDFSDKFQLLGDRERRNVKYHKMNSLKKEQEISVINYSSSFDTDIELQNGIEIRQSKEKKVDKKKKLPKSPKKVKDYNITEEESIEDINKNYKAKTKKITKKDKKAKCVSEVFNTPSNILIMPNYQPYLQIPSSSKSYCKPNNIQFESRLYLYVTAIYNS
jgi:hypothetical protein